MSWEAYLDKEDCEIPQKLDRNKNNINNVDDNLTFLYANAYSLVNKVYDLKLFVDNLDNT